jgi:hypothetical protein
MLLSRQLFFEFNYIVFCTDSWLIQEDTVVCFIVMSEGTATRVWSISSGVEPFTECKALTGIEGKEATSIDRVPIV